MLLCSITFVRKNYFLNCRLGLTNVSLLCINLHLLVTHDKVLAKISPISNNRKLIEKIWGIAVCLISCVRGFLENWSFHLQLHFSQSFLHQFLKTILLSCLKFPEFVYTPPLVWFWPIYEGFMASRVQKIMFWDTFKNAKSVILDFFPVAEIGSNIQLLYFSYP